SLKETVGKIDEIVSAGMQLGADDVRSLREAAEVTADVDVDHFGLAVAENVTSYCWGLVVGRWDVRYATGERAAPMPSDPDPFVPLPICPPGELQNDEGLPARPEDVSRCYPVRIAWDGILVDDPNHSRDIERRLREVIEIIWTERASAVEQETCEILR